MMSSSLSHRYQSEVGRLLQYGMSTASILGKQSLHPACSTLDTCSSSSFDLSIPSFLDMALKDRPRRLFRYNSSAENIGFSPLSLRSTRPLRFTRKDSLFLREVFRFLMKAVSLTCSFSVDTHAFCFLTAPTLFFDCDSSLRVQSSHP